MIIAEKVKNAVSGKIANLSLEAVTKEFCLISCLFHRNYNITENLCACFGIGVINTVFAHWERKNIGFNVLVTILLV